jgi:hypothetical protein
MQTTHVAETAYRSNGDSTTGEERARRVLEVLGELRRQNQKDAAMDEELDAAGRFYSK